MSNFQLFPISHIHKMDFLVSLYIFCLMGAELMGVKTFPLLHVGNFKLNASIAIFLLPIIFSINDVIAEVYGGDRAKSVVRCGLIIVFLIFAFAFFVTYLPPSPRFVEKEEAFDTIFGGSVRIAAASLIAYLCLIF